MRWTGTVFRLGVAGLLGLTACDRGTTTRLDDEPLGHGGSDAPSQSRSCDKLENAALERWVIEASADGSYSRERLLEMTDLTVIGASSLDGIECLPHLTKLFLADGSLQDVSALSALAELEILTITNHQLDSLSSLPALPKVWHLDIAKNHVTDLATLPVLPALTDVYVSLNPLTSLAPLNAYPDLQVLWATGAELRNLDGLSLSKLVELHADENQLGELGDLSQLSALRILDVTRNQLKRLQGVEGLSQLERLEVGQNPLESVAEIVSLGRLESLDISSTHVTDLAPLAAGPRLRYLTLSDTPITSLAPLSGWAEGDGDCRRLDVTNVALDDASNELLSSGFCARNWGVRPTCSLQCFDPR